MKKQKLALVVVLLLLCVGLAFSLTSCGEDDGEHTHTPNSVVRENEIAATCEAAGSYDEVVYCAECSKEMSRTTKTIEKLSHTPSEWITDIEASCKVEGTKHKECILCHTELETGKIDKLTIHTPAEAIRENEVAAKCDALGSYDEVIYCSVCDIQISRISKDIAKLPHTEAIDKSVEPTCTETGLTEGKHCSVCSTVLVAQEAVKANGHTEVIDKAVEATETSDGLTEGKHCDICGETILAQQVIPATLQGTAVKSDILTVDGDRIYGSVSNTTTTFSFLNDITVNDNASYLLSTDINCNDSDVVRSKTANLTIGNNTFYIFVTNGGKEKLYTVTIRRLPMYTVSFNTNGGTELETISFEEGNFEYPETSKVGYNLNGWTVNGKLVSFPYSVTEDVEFEAVFSPVVYDITYEIFGGVNAEGNPDSYTIETSTITLGTPTRDYYDFCGWYDNADFEGNAVKEITVGSIGDVKLYAKWTPTVYEIKYNLNNSENGDGNPESYTVESNTIILAEPTRIGYDFKGWFTNEKCTDGITEISHGSHGNVEVWAKWTPTIYNVKYNLGGGENHKDNPATYTIESTTITLAEPTRTGYTFEGWSVDSAFNGEVFEIAAGSHENIEVWAKWIPIVYDITYNLNGGENHDDNPATYTIESETIIFADPKRAGYDFIGWYADEEFNTEIKEIISGSYGSVDVYAKWEALFTVVDNSITGFTDYGKANVIDLNIPTSIDGVAITSIAAYAFENCTNLTSVTIPDSVTNIGYDAFLNCSALNGVYITDIAQWCELTFVNSSANPLKEASKLYLNGVFVEKLIVPDNVTSISPYVFEKCTTITSVVIGKNVTSIGSYAFRDCQNIVSVTIPDGVVTIGSSAFYNCNSLARVTIPDSVTSIGNNAFANCASLASVNFGENSKLTKIERGAFSECSSLTSITIPEQVTSIGYEAFYECTGLTEINLNAINMTVDWSYAYNHVFYNAGISGDGIKVTIGKNVRKIPYKLFCPYWYNGASNTPKIVSVEFEEGSVCESIEDMAFAGCYGIVSVAIPKSVTNFGSGVFAGCNRLTSITVDIDNTAYQSIEGNLYSKDGKTLIQYAVGKAETVIIVPDSVVEINDYAFWKCVYLESVIIPNGVTKIGYSAFYGCYMLTNVTIGDNITSIGIRAFEYCSNITSVYYRGVASEWDSISIGMDNTDLINAIRYYYSDNEPTLNADGTAYNGNYWYYDENGDIAIWKK